MQPTFAMDDDPDILFGIVLRDIFDCVLNNVDLSLPVGFKLLVSNIE